MRRDPDAGIRNLDDGVAVRVGQRGDSDLVRGRAGRERLRRVAQQVEDAVPERLFAAEHGRDLAQLGDHRAALLELVLGQVQRSVDRGAQVDAGRGGRIEVRERAQLAGDAIDPPDPLAGLLHQLDPVGVLGVERTPRQLERREPAQRQLRRGERVRVLVRDAASQRAQDGVVIAARIAGARAGRARAQHDRQPRPARAVVATPGREEAAGARVDLRIDGRAVARACAGRDERRRRAERRQRALRARGDRVEAERGERDRRAGDELGAQVLVEHEDHRAGARERAVQGLGVGRWGGRGVDVVHATSCR